LIELRRADGGDLPHLRRALFEAIAWDPERELPPFELVIKHPVLARYHAGWGRPGDLAVIAESEGAAVGASLCRVFTDDGHGHGFVDERNPARRLYVRMGYVELTVDADGVRMLRRL
jgi:hypothetical protein